MSSEKLGGTPIEPIKLGLHVPQNVDAWRLHRAEQSEKIPDPIVNLMHSSQSYPPS